MVINRLAHVTQKTIKPFIREPIALGAHIDTDEYRLDARLGAWGYDQKSVNHGRGAYA